MSTLADAGPLVALIDRGQGEVHRICAAALKDLSGPLVTTWPCFTEAMYFLGARAGWKGQESLWNLVGNGTIAIHAHTKAEEQRMRVLMEKYRDTPMDLADASLVVAAETQQLRRIFTLDSDFTVYRLQDGSAPTLVP